MSSPPSSPSPWHIASIGIPNLLPSLTRTPGPHVSDIIHYLCIRLGHYDEREDNELSPAVQSRMQIGCAFEDIIADRLSRDSPDRYVRVGEIERDGIFGHPDLVDTRDTAVEEDKATWLSAKHGPGSSKFWKWEVQLKAYCYMLEIPLGRLRVCYLNGDYKWTRSAESGVYVPLYERRFTEGELEDNWGMLLDHLGLAMVYKAEIAARSLAP